MKASIRRAAFSAAAGAAVFALVTGCSSKDEPAAAKSSAPAAQKLAEESPEPSAPASSAPALSVGQTGTYGLIETDEYGENPLPSTTMQVTVKSAEYVTPADVDTTTKPKLGQYVRLTLTVKNVGKKEGVFSGYGMIKWENKGTAAQDATTLEGVGTGPELDTTYKPGQAVTGSLVLDVGAKGGTLSYWDDLDVPAFTVKLPTS